MSWIGEIKEGEGPCRDAEEAVEFERVRVMASRYREFEGVRMVGGEVIVEVVKVS